MSVDNPVVGDIVHVTFLDHSCNFQDVIEFEVFGRVSKVSDVSIQITSWGHTCEIDRRILDCEEDGYNIVRACISDMTILAPKQEATVLNGYEIQFEPDFLSFLADIPYEDEEEPSWADDAEVIVNPSKDSDKPEKGPFADD